MRLNTALVDSGPFKEIDIKSRTFRCLDTHRAVAVCGKRHRAPCSPAMRSMMVRFWMKSAAPIFRRMCRLRELPVQVVHAGHDASFGRERLVALVDAYLAKRA